VLPHIVECARHVGLMERLNEESAPDPKFLFKMRILMKAKRGLCQVYIRRGGLPAFVLKEMEALFESVKREETIFRSKPEKLKGAWTMK